MSQPQLTTGGQREPALPAGLARMWGAISAAHHQLERRRGYFLNTPVDDRLGEQLGLVPMLHDWVPVSADELGEFVGLLEDYARAPDEDTVGRAAARVVHAVRVMAGTRARLTAG